MIKNETEIRVAVQAVLVSVLALNGFWGCALVVMVLLLPWSPFLRMGSYLIQPIVDWRIRKASDRHEQGLAQIEHQLDTFLIGSKSEAAAPLSSRFAEMELSTKPSEIKMPKALEMSKVTVPSVQPLEKLSPTPPNFPATLAIPSVIADHIKNSPHGAFSNMDLEVERVNFNGEIADVLVKFKSPNVKELAIRQRYVLRKSGERWEVDSQYPANGPSRGPNYPMPNLPSRASTHVGRA
jgi:hypothetical protein